MRHTPYKLIPVLAALLAASVACQLPGSAAPAAPTAPASGPVGTPTMNLTLTAVFANSATPIPSGTPAPPTATAQPDAAAATPTILAITAPTLTPAQAGGGQGTPSVLQPETNITPIVLDFGPTATPAEDEETPEDTGRPGPAVEAAYLTKAPRIDGNLSDFSTPVYLLNTAVFGNGFTSGDGDISGQARFGWDGTFLYIGVRVIDNKFVQTATAAQLWRGDSLELLLDADLTGDFERTLIDADDYQLGLSPGDLLLGNTPEAFLWAPRGQVGVPAGVQIAAALTADGYQMEIAVPWALFGLQPDGGEAYGFLLSLSDNDDPSTPRQQTVVSFAPGRALHDPTTWRTLILLAP